MTAIQFEQASPVEVMSLDGNLQVLGYNEIKAMCFVSESGPANLFSEHLAFERRPKVPGLWTRFNLRDGDCLDGVLSHNLAEWPEAGFLAIPPRAGSSRQRVFMPRAAVSYTELRGIIGKPALRRPASHGITVAGQRGLETDNGQLSMFD